MKTRGAWAGALWPDAKVDRRQVHRMRKYHVTLTEASRVRSSLRLCKIVYLMIQHAVLVRHRLGDAVHNMQPPGVPHPASLHYCACKWRTRSVCTTGSLPHCSALSFQQSDPSMQHRHVVPTRAAGYNLVVLLITSNKRGV
jgi:hypothetical protein